MGSVSINGVDVSSDPMSSLPFSLALMLLFPSALGRPQHVLRLRVLPLCAGLPWRQSRVHQVPVGLREHDYFDPPAKRDPSITIDGTTRP